MIGLKSILEKDERMVVGLMSGTSVDGIDAALVRIKGSGASSELELLGFECLPIEGSIKERIGNPMTLSIGELSGLNFVLGKAFADAALAVIDSAGFKPRDIDLIGSHGQTVFHDPPSRNPQNPSTLQIGELDVIAKTTGITTVGDFRTADVAVGGEGAPIVSYVDYVLFKSEEGIKIAQNIGGIANATLVTFYLRQVMAFDTGPGNMLMDGVMRLATDGEASYDRDGETARSGRVLDDLLSELLANPYYSKEPPKSTGAELFGPTAVEGIYKRVSSGEFALEDVLRTLLELTVETIARSYEKFLFPKLKPTEVIVSGGGAENPFLMERLGERLSPLPVVTSDKYGIPVDAKEAIAMAVLANELISSNHTNIISVTGAEKCVPIGKIALGGAM